MKDDREGSAEESADTDRVSRPNEQDTPGEDATLDAPTVGLSNTTLVGSRLAGYRVLRRLGRGGMADVYSARDMELDRDVAVKVLRRDLARDRDYIARFRREAKAAAKLNHGNIVQIYEVGEEQERYYIAQELIDGVNLRQWLDRDGALDAEQAIVVLYGVASALDAAATEGITHRDIKPENLMWSKSGEVKVADFGLARLGNDGDSRAGLTQAGLTLGTPRYMSPEQVQGHKVDPRSDLYSLGVTMYHLLAGRPPFEADDPLALAFSHVNETPKPLDRTRGKQDLPEWLIAIIAKLMRKDPKDRFQSPGELLDALTGDSMGGRENATRLAGAAAAAARLQRVADEQKQARTRQRWRLVTLALIPVLCALVGAVAAGSVGRYSIVDVLKPDDVPKQETVEEQFYDALSSNYEAAWRAVPAYFPPEENAVNRTYASKAMLQLARNFRDGGSLEDADSVLSEVIDDPAVARKFRLLASAWRIPILRDLSRQTDAVVATRQLKTLYEELRESNPDAIEWFHQMVPTSERESLGLSRKPGE
ncbi:MAG: serine/threonine-protein kinase [Planctomycetota bacterium]